MNHIFLHNRSKALLFVFFKTERIKIKEELNKNNSRQYADDTA